MDIRILLSPPVAFFVFVLVALGFNALGRLMAGAPVAEPGKSEPYACGEEYHAEKNRFGYAKVWVAALFFTIMPVAALAIAPVPQGVHAYKALRYLAAIAVSIALLFVDFY